MVLKPQEPPGELGGCTANTVPQPPGKVVQEVFPSFATVPYNTPPSPIAKGDGPMPAYGSPEPPSKLCSTVMVQEPPEDAGGANANTVPQPETQPTPLKPPCPVVP